MEKKNSLVVIWTSGDRYVAERMVFMYTLASKLEGWWEDVCLIIWGPSQPLLCEDMGLQKYVKKMKEVGIVLKACKGCSDMYDGVSEKLEKLGFEVEYVGKPLTGYMKEGRKILTF